MSTMGSNGERERAAQPEDLGRFFIDRVNAGDVDGVVALYESDAVLMSPPGQVTTGSPAIRQVYEWLLAGKPTLTATLRPTVQSGDLALTSVQWSMRMTGRDGQPLTLSGTSAEVVHRQPDGTWLWVIDQPDILG